MATLTVPNAVPSPAEDAESLRKAVQGWGTDEKGVIAVLAHRNAAQRKQIRLAYEEIYHEDLIKRLESELSGDFEKAVYRWMFEPDERDAILANVALNKGSLDSQVLLETACIRSPDELLAVKKAYQAHYKHSLEEDVASHTTGNFRQLLVALVGTYRYGGDEINVNIALSEAKILHDAIGEKAFFHEEVIRILCTRSKAQLNATFNCYKDKYGTSITKDLAAGPYNEFAVALQTVIRCIRSPHKYLEKVLRYALRKHGADDDVVTRIIVTSAEKDLKKIKELYFKRNSATLNSAVAKDTFGDYKAFLLALIGE